MIYDCFMFYNELDLLEIRLNELNDVVDKFIISECTRTFSNQPKELLLEKHKERFKKFWHKIEHIIIDENDLPYFNDSWTYENYQRNIMSKALENCNSNDIIIISDLDEIPDIKVIKELKDFEGIKILEMKQYNFYLNYLNSKEPVWKRGTRVFHYKELLNNNLTGIRLSEGSHIENAGWHFSFLGGVEKVKEKIEAFSHQEYNNEYYTDIKRLEKSIKEGKDIFERGYEYQIVSIDKSFPEYILKNKEKFSELILNQLGLKEFILNKFSKFNLKNKRRYIEDYKTHSKYELLDFISPNTNKIIEIGNYNQDFSEKLKEKFNDGYYFLNIEPELLTKLKELDDNCFDCVVFNDSFCQIYDIERVLELLKKKMNKNGYIIANVYNIRYIKILEQLFIKKQWKYSDKGILNWKNIRCFSKKSLENIFSSLGYYFITFKGLNSCNSIGYKFLNLIWFKNLNDCRYEKFLIVVKF